MLYRTLKRLIDLRRTDGLAEKIDVFYATGKLTETEYNELTGIFHRSAKSETGALESRAGWKGLCRKGMTLLIVIIAHRLDLMLGTTVIRDAVVIAFVANETMSIIENAGLMGVPIPAAIVKAIDVLNAKASEEGKHHE